jgi:hypothetical protein
MSNSWVVEGPELVYLLPVAAIVAVITLDLAAHSTLAAFSSEPDTPSTLSTGV